MLSGLIGRKAHAGGLAGLSVKFWGLTPELPGKLPSLRTLEGSGTHGVGVKSVDIMWNTEGEGSSLGRS